MYNILRAEINNVPTITPARLNKALGIAQTKKYERPYYMTIDTCTCPDSVQRTNIVCKHRLALMLQNPTTTLLLKFNEEGPWDPIHQVAEQIRVGA